MSTKASYQVFHKVMCWIAIKFKEIQPGVFKVFFFDERRIAKSVVNKHFNCKLFSQILDNECVEGKRVLTMCKYNFPHEKKNRRGGGSV